MKRVIRLTESDLTRIVSRVIRESRETINEGYDIGSTFKVGATTYTIDGIGTMNCNFSIKLLANGKSMSFDNMNQINNLSDVNLKNTLIAISKEKLRSVGC
jgi:hypothetical protein